MPLFNIVLNKDNDNGSGGSNDCCPFTFGSIMGQEDVYSEATAGSGVRDTSGALTAIIRWATSVDATSRVEWGIGESLVYGNDTGVVASGNTYHEVTIPGLGLDTLYHFRVISTSTECNPAGETLTSEGFWFETGGELVVSSNQIEFNITNEVLSIGANATATVMDDISTSIDLTGIASTIRDPLSLIESTSIPTVGTTQQHTADNTMLFVDTPSTAVT